MMPAPRPRHRPALPVIGLALLFGTTAAAAQTPLSPRDSAVHALNRLAFGPAPGEIDAVAKRGVLRWIDDQLDRRAAGDPALRDRENGYALLHHSPDQLAAMYGEVRMARARERRDATAMDERRGTVMPGDAAMDSGMTARRVPPPLTPEQRAVRQLGGQLEQVAVLRAVASQHQLGEVLTDFWTNHFNIFYNKGADRWLLPTFVEATIRPRVLGKFEDLLIATAKSPAMLFYLDNVRSVAPGATPPEARRRFARQANQPTGLNENYARELLELHTLGVDGGYTQQDVIAVARVLTGWGMKAGRQGSGFEFHAWAHDDGAKTVLGVAFPAGHGEDEGVRLLKLLANHPATMHHVSAKLCERFVADQAPDGCIDDAVRAWQRTGGDLREVLRAIVQSPDFWSPANARSKVKSPFEFAMSAARAVGADPDTSARLAQVVRRLGQPLFQQTSPAGYPERSDEWTNSGALLARMNAAMQIASGKLPGLTVDLDRVVPATGDHDALLARVNDAILGGTMTDGTRRVIAREIAGASDSTMARNLAVGLALGGPEFQRQ